MNETKHTKFKKGAAALAVASCLSLTPLISEAAGLGKLTVLSGLGQPLRAELDIATTRDEAAGMTARLAPQEAFRQAGVDYASVLLDLRFAVEKRPNGQAVVKVTSSKPVNEPFLDFLVELNWPSGRLVREYTFLLDPPEIAAKQTSAPVAEARVIETVRGGGAVAERPVPVRAAPRVAAVPKAPPEPKKQAAAGDHVVKPGETLRKIAAENKYQGVSLEQMLVGYFQKNPEAFIGNNVNRVKSGAILSMPEKSAVEAISEADAKKVYVAQSGDWNAYRQKLAAATAKAPAKAETASQSSTGKITAKVEEKATPAEQSKDQVKVSRTEMPVKGSETGKSGGVAEADLIAREKALKEAQDRLALLEKNVGELQKLVEMKNQKLAELTQQSSLKKEEPKPVEAIKPVEPPKPLEPPKPVEPPKVPVEIAKPVEPKVPELANPVEPPKQPAVVKAPPPPPPEPEMPGFFDSLLSDPLPLAGGGGLLALLGGYFIYKRRRNQNASVETTAAPGPSSLGPNSVFRMTGGQSVDTGNTPPQTGDFSQTGPGTIDTDEVDPVAEADVYMAYGRDTQAEEILLEALQKDPQRTAIHAKLLEIYANRRSLKQFETLAGELYAQTGGAGPEWQKVAALGAGLDPNNPLYSGGAVATPGFDADATMIVSPEELSKATLVMPAAQAPAFEQVTDESISRAEEFERDTLVLPGKNSEPAPEAVPVELVTQEAETPVADDGLSLDFDLGTSESTAEIKAEEPPVTLPEMAFDTSPDSASDALDFDLGGEPSVPVRNPPVGELHVSEDDTSVPEVIDFDLDLPAASRDYAAGDASPDFSPAGTMVLPNDTERAATTYVGLELHPEEPPEPLPTKEDESPVVDFDFDLDEPATATSINAVLQDPSAASMVASMDFDDPSATVVSSMPFISPQDEDNQNLVATVVNPEALSDDSLDFDVKLTDSVFLGQPMTPPEFDIGSINLDLSAEQFDGEALTPPAPAQRSEVSQPATEAAVVEPLPASEEVPAADSGAVAELPAGNWEEVNTKLDLAKAYEEMGDLEGARELLQEVVGEGPVDLVEQARAILARIGE